MSLIGDIKSVFEVFASCWAWIRRQRDPLRSRAQRLLTAFDAHGIGATRIDRILPSEFQLSPAALSDPSRLKDELTPRILDWASDYLALNRRWLDGVDDLPHRYVDGYKKEHQHAEWLTKQNAISSPLNRMLYVLTEEDPCRGRRLCGPITLILVEEINWIDDETLRRYRLFSLGYRIDHGNCVKSVLTTVKLLEDREVQIIGRLVPAATLRKVEAGEMFIPQAFRHFGAIWYPEDLVSRLASP